MTCTRATVFPAAQHSGAGMTIRDAQVVEMKRRVGAKGNGWGDSGSAHKSLASASASEAHLLAACWVPELPLGLLCTCKAGAGCTADLRLGGAVQ